MMRPPTPTGREALPLHEHAPLPSTYVVGPECSPRRSTASRFEDTMRSCPLWLMLLLGCSGQHAAEGDDICREAAQAVAQRSVSCGGDTETANARYSAVLDEFACIANPESAPNVDCAVAINALTCDQVQTLGDEPDGWVSRGECQNTFDLAQTSSNALQSAANEAAGR